MLDDQGEAFLVRLGGIPLGGKEPFDALVQALTGAGITESDALRKRLPFTQDTAAWLWVFMSLLGIALFGGMAWSLVRMTQDLHLPSSEELRRHQERPPVLPRRVVPVRHFTRGGEKETHKP
ncbi:hypothetical protein [Armatimonas sp.]|uniref:hypothetical protein n=1 Tax=Armatimonas sp. TaxID=1872638 RepID=UPI003751BC15